MTLIEQRESTAWWDELDGPTVITITPVMAARLLDVNVVNRTLKQNVVEQLTRQMNEGLWRFNGESIVISSDGNLLDGQHRLSSVVASGIAQQFLVVTGVDSDSQSTIDTGSARTAGDVLSMHSIPNANSVAAVLRMVHAYTTVMAPIPTMVPAKLRPKPQEIVDLLDQHPDVVEHVIRAKRIATLGRSEVAFCSYAFSYVETDLPPLIDVMISGEGSVMSPARVLTDRLINDGLNGRRLTATDRMALAFRAHNAYVGQRQMKVVKGIISRGRTQSESFPRLERTSFPFLPEVAP